jgi:hypothetical protein
MTYPPIPGPAPIASHVTAALRASRRLSQPYTRWAVTDIFPEPLCTAILVLPLVPPMLGTTDGTRNSYNARRSFFTPALRRDFPVCQSLATALQRPGVARQLSETCDFDAEGTYLRIEYIQDTDGMWLEPHRDIPAKIFSMVVYLCTGPEAADWGTDIYDEHLRWVGRSSAEFNSATIFKAGPDTWHGFEKRPIRGVRRLMEINYVRDWRDRDQLAYPDQPITLTDPPPAS